MLRHCQTLAALYLSFNGEVTKLCNQNGRLVFSGATAKVSGQAFLIPSMQLSGQFVWQKNCYKILAMHGGSVYSFTL